MKTPGKNSCQICKNKNTHENARPGDHTKPGSHAKQQATITWQPK